MSRFEFFHTALPGVTVVHRNLIEDDRGFLARLWCAEEFAGTVWGRKPLAQINHTLTYRCGSVRGMHFQHPPYAEVKLVTCVRGKIFDVAVDVRKNSPTFLKWHGEILSDVNQHALMIPEGFAHGFQTLTDNCELLYLHSAPFASAFEGGLNPVDQKLAIVWPATIDNLSDRDRAHSMLRDDYEGVAI